MGKDVVIRLTNISKCFKLYPNRSARIKEIANPLKRSYHTDFYALKNINLAVNRGEILGIIGKNGSGKSTLLKVIAGVQTQTGGLRKVSGKVVALLELGAGFNPEFTGIENIYFYGSIMGYSKEEMKAKADEIIEFAEIGEFIEQPLKKYSSGMKARLGFSVAINVDPDILIVDEVLAVGDELFKAKCHARFKKFIEMEKTILFVTHQVNVAEKLCSRSILLHEGSIILEGPSKLVTHQYHRFLYTEVETAKRVIRDIVRINRDPVLKEKVIEEMYTMDEEDEPADFEGEVSKKVRGSVKPKPYLIPNFVPKTTMIIKNRDLEVEDIHVQSLEGERVNVLVSGEQYRLLFRVRFGEPLSKVKIAVAFRSGKGVVMSGIVLPSKTDHIDSVRAGQEIELDILFRCSLLRGKFFTGISIVAESNEVPVTALRIEDGFVFRVQGMTASCWGRVDLVQSFTLRQIE